MSMSSPSLCTFLSWSQMGNGEWSVYILQFSPLFHTVPFMTRVDSHNYHSRSQQTHEVIGSPPNVAVPTHFAKVVLASKPSSPSTPDILDISMGAFVLPNAVIPDEAPLESFVMPGKPDYFDTVAN